ncbi:hypothetical protein [Acinetobacter phage Ab65]|nr:hypothetical protein [Acinetobacter phage Ab31]WMC00532.1 hypothetical protein [Acinetobacter phage Ab59]WMC00624.1 hypothetical protein [Acinetobacter phage Ab65]
MTNDHTQRGLQPRVPVLLDLQSLFMHTLRQDED